MNNPVDSKEPISLSTPRLSSDEERQMPGAQAVGYGRPPVERRFQPGKSGNPRGRPKGIKSIGKLFAEALARRVTVQENGRPRKIRMQDLIIQGLVNDAARRERRAVQLLFSLLDRYGDGREQEFDAAVLSQDDQAIINRYITGALAATQMQGTTNDATPSQDTANAGQEPPTESTSNAGKVQNDEP